MKTIGDYIAEDNPLRAFSFVEELEERCFSLEDFPLAYPFIPNRKSSGIRRLVHKKYNIFYSVSDTAVHVLHVLNGASDYEKILVPEE